MCKWRIAALCLSDSGTGYKNQPLLLEEGYILLHSDSGTMSIPAPPPPPITEYFGHRNRTPIFKIVARNGLEVFCLEHSRNKFKYPSPHGGRSTYASGLQNESGEQKSLRLATDVGGYGLDKHILKRFWGASFVYQATSS